MRLDVLRSATMLDSRRVTAVGDAADLKSEVGARHRRRPRHAVSENDFPGLRFAFYGRMSTEDYQDRESSSHWQREAAEETIADRGVIVAEYFDTGSTRAIPWAQRPQATALLRAAAEPDRRFDAIVIGEYERAFYGDQFQSCSPRSPNTVSPSDCPRPVARST